MSIYADLAKFEFAPDEPGYELVQQMSNTFSNSVIVNDSMIIPLVYIIAMVLTVGAIIFDEKITKTRISTGF